MSGAGGRDAWESALAPVVAAGGEADFATLTKAGNAVSRAIQGGVRPPDSRTVNIFVLRSMTLEVVVPPLVAELALRGVAAKATLGDIGNFGAEIRNPLSPLRAGAFDIAVLALDAEAAMPAMATVAAGDELAADAAEWQATIADLAGHFAGKVIVGTLVPPPDLVAPHFQANTESSARYQIEAANKALAKQAGSTRNIAVWDIDAVARTLGDRFWSLRDAATAMQPYSAAAIPALARSLADVIAMTLTPPAKAIVLDCDNTLWGGVVGEDGLDGIRLGEGYPGNMHARFQRQLGQLSRIGFLLAVCSKNEERDVREVFDKHPRTHLRWPDFSAAEVNWNDKSANIESISEQLNIGTDSLVFVDDSDFELNRVRESLPGVTVAKVPPQTYLLPRLLGGIRRLDRLRVTAEDVAKRRQYTDDRTRRSMRASAESLDDYLASLEMVLTVERYRSGTHTARAAQLTQKTNQFNLTTIRYTEADIDAADAAGAIILVGSLRDRVGDYGRIALAIVRPDQQDTGRLDTLLMSCRAIGRGVEERFMGEVLHHAHERGLRSIHASYTPTLKNAICRDYLQRMGFSLLSEAENGRREYRIDIDTTVGERPSPIRLEANG